MKTIFKKIAAVCLSMAVMVGVMGATNWGNSAVAASPNLLETSSFEAEGTLPSYRLSDAKAAFLAGNLNGWFAGGNANYGKDGAIVAEDGNYALSMTGRASQQIKGLAAGSTYVVRFKAKRTAAYRSATVNLRCRIVKTNLDAEIRFIPLPIRLAAAFMPFTKQLMAARLLALATPIPSTALPLPPGATLQPTIACCYSLPTKPGKVPIA